MLSETEVTIAGFKFEKIDGKRIIQSVFLLDTERGNCIEIPVLNDENIDKVKLTKELLEYYRKEVVAIIDVRNSINKSNKNYVDLGFVGIKSNHI